MMIYQIANNVILQLKYCFLNVTTQDGLFVLLFVKFLVSLAVKQVLSLGHYVVCVHMYFDTELLCFHYMITYWDTILPSMGNYITLKTQYC